jgi:hypothetical protein
VTWDPAPPRAGRRGSLPRDESEGQDQALIEEALRVLLGCRDDVVMITEPIDQGRGLVVRHGAGCRQGDHGGRTQQIFAHVALQYITRAGRSGGRESARRRPVIALAFKRGAEHRL